MQSNRYKYNLKCDVLSQNSKILIIKAYDEFLHIPVCLRFFSSNCINEENPILEINKGTLYFHPNISSILLVSQNNLQDYEIPQEKYPYFLVEEYNEAVNIRQYFSSKTLSKQDFNEIITQIIHGLDYLYADGRIHGDLLPECISVSNAEGVPKVKITNYFNSTNTSCLRGFILDEQNLIYKSPEFIQDNLPTKKADIWSLGMIMYELLKGQPLINDLKEIEILKNNQEAELTKIIHQKLEDIPKPYQAILQQCLKVNSNHRNISIDKVAFFLHHADPEPEETYKIGNYKNRKNKKMLLYALEVMGVSAIAFGLGWWLREHKVVNVPVILEPVFETVKIDSIHDSIQYVYIEKQVPVFEPQRSYAKSTISNPTNAETAKAAILPSEEIFRNGKEIILDLNKYALKKGVMLVSTDAEIKEMSPNKFYIHASSSDLISIVAFDKESSVEIERKNYANYKPVEKEALVTLGDDLCNSTASNLDIINRSTLNVKSNKGDIMIRSFRMSNKDFEDFSETNSLNIRMKKYLMNIKPGQKIFFDQIKGQDESGTSYDLKDFYVIVAEN